MANDDKKSFAESIMDSMMGRRSRPEDDVTRVASAAGAELDRMLFAARSMQNMYVDVQLKPVNVNQSLEVNIDNISKNFTALDNKIRVVDQSVRVASVLLDSNKKLMQATSASIAKAIADSKRTDSRNAFSEIESRMEESRVIDIVDRRINAWMDAGYFGGGSNGIADSLIGSAVGATVARMSAGRMIAAAGAITIKALPALAAVIAVPQAVENPNANMFTELGHMIDDLKTMIDPTYKGHQAEELTKIFTNYLSKETKRIWAEEKAKKEKQRAEEEHIVDEMKKIAAQTEENRKIYEDSRKKILEPYTKIVPGWIQGARNDRNAASTNGSDMGREVLFDPMQYIPRREDFYNPMFPADTDRKYQKAMDAWKKKYGIPDNPTSILPIPDELKPEPKETIPELKIPDEFRIKKTSSIRQLGRIHTASLGDGREFLSNPDDAYYDKIGQLLTSSEDAIVESFKKKFDEYSLETSSFIVNARMMDFYSFSTLNIESMSELSIVSKKTLTIEAPEIVLRGALRYEGIKGYVGTNRVDSLGPAPGMPSIPGPTNAQMFPAGGYQPSQELYSQNRSGSGSGGGYSSGGGGSSGGPTSDRVGYAMSYFMSQGWTQAQAAGIVGNLMQESYTYLDHTATNGSHRGVAQWDSTRQAKFEQVYGKPFAESTLDEQLAFINWELNNTHKKAGNALRATNDPRQAALVFENLFEVSGGSALGNRQNYADQAMGSLLTGDGSGGSNTPLGMLDRGSMGASSNGKPAENALAIAAKYKGLDERNPQDAKTLAKLFKSEAGIDLDPATAAWCAAFMNGVLGEAGMGGTGKATARSFLNYGTAVTDPQPGDIVVFDRGGGWKGHVGMITGVEERGGKTYLKVLGGNQSTSDSQGEGVTVNIKEFTTDQVLGYRRPPKSDLAAGKFKEQVEEKPKKPLEISDTANTGSKLMENAAKPNVIAPIVQNEVNITREEQKKIRNTHDNVNMSASKGLTESAIV